LESLRLRHLSLYWTALSIARTKESWSSLHSLSSRSNSSRIYCCLLYPNQCSLW